MILSSNPEAVIARMQHVDSETMTARSSRPLLIEQITLMGAKQFWSSTHNWPWVRMKFMEMGIVREARDVRGALPGQPVTDITDLGLEVRAILCHETRLEAAE